MLLLFFLSFFFLERCKKGRKKLFLVGEVRMVWLSFFFLLCPPEQSLLHLSFLSLSRSYVRRRRWKKKREEEAPSWVKGLFSLSFATEEGSSFGGDPLLAHTHSHAHTLVGGGGGTGGAPYVHTLLYNSSFQVLFFALLYNVSDQSGPPKGQHLLSCALRVYCTVRVWPLRSQRSLLS